MSKVTIRDIARQTGLAMNTVSKVLNKKPYYSKAAEKKVLGAADELGYIKNLAASALKRGSSRLIGVVFDDFVNPYYSFMTNILAHKFTRLNYDVMIFSSYGASSFLMPSLLRHMLSHKVDGIITFLQPDADSVALIKKNSLPLVLLGRDSRSLGIDSIFGNDKECGRLATLHLLEEGFSRVAYIGSDPAISVDNLRFEGYKQVLSERNIPFDPSLVLYRMNFETYDGIAEYFLKMPDVRAFFCFNDYFSFGLIKAFAKLGLFSPNDYRLVGCDNIQSFLSLPNILTTIGSDHVKMADISADILLNRINNLPCDQKISEYSFAVELVKGQTT